MICKKITFFLISLVLCAPAFAETSIDNGPDIYVPDYRLERILQTASGDLYAVRDSLKRIDGFVEFWARVVPKDQSEKTQQFWNSEKITLTANTAYSHFKIHFYCRDNTAAIPAVYLFDDESQPIYSLVVLMDDPYMTNDKPLTRQLKGLACSGKLDWLNDRTE
jgi:hypothetical protein